MNFADLLDRLDTLLQQLRPDYYATLNPPAPVAEIVALEAEFGLVLPPELQLWFGWRNGQQGFDNFFQNNGLQSVSSAAATMRVNCKMLAAEEFVPNWWGPAWVPFLENGGGDHICLDLEGSFTGRPGQVLQHWHDWEPRSVLFPDLTSWLTAVVHTYEQAGTAAPLSEDDVVNFKPEYPAGFPQEFEAG
ncbi:SMI1/KNR4 family protein [Hymenobacter terrenus]|uniref:SMI1/KNR4 family protein n=1 Tax=Hymenobacter terrenus TaxID=1629124 RepID=UPI000619A188|nr:SMI1/KNR4 family protein [Hymenobacter terrenus]